jgi:hypothetical protein
MRTEGLYIDHVIYGVVDIDAAAERLRREHGLGSVPGAIHLGGTTNLIVPLAPPTFIELLGVGDPTLGDGAWLSQTLAGRDRVLWWALGTDDLDESARRRGLPVQSGRMDMSDGPPRTFRTTGMPQFPLPFFISYDIETEARLQLSETRYRDARHECEPGAFAFVEAGGAPEFLDTWLGDHGLPVRHAPTTAPGICAVGIETARGQVVIR